MNFTKTKKKGGGGGGVKDLIGIGILKISWEIESLIIFLSSSTFIAITLEIELFTRIVS